MSTTLAYVSKASRVQRASATDDAQASLGKQGLRIHQLMDSLEGTQARRDPELQSKLLELKRVLRGIDPLLDKVEKRLDVAPGFDIDSPAGDSSRNADGLAASQGAPGIGQGASSAHMSTAGLEAVEESDEINVQAVDGRPSGLKEAKANVRDESSKVRCENVWAACVP